MNDSKWLKANGGTKLLLVMVGSLLVAATLGYFDFRSEKRRTDERTNKAVEYVERKIISGLTDSLRQERKFLVENQLKIIRAVMAAHSDKSLDVDTLQIKSYLRDSIK